MYAIFLIHRSINSRRIQISHDEFSNTEFKMIDYLLSLQIYACVYVIAATGYMCGGLKLFNSRDVESIRRILNLVCIPGLIFRQVGRQKFTFDTFKPFFIGLLFQGIVQILVTILSFILPGESKGKRYINYLLSCSYSEILFVGLPVVDFLFGSEYVHIPIMLSMVEFLVIMPIHNVIAFKINGPPVDQPEEEPIDDPNEMELEDTSTITIENNVSLTKFGRIDAVETTENVNDTCLEPLQKTHDNLDFNNSMENLSNKINENESNLHESNLTDDLESADNIETNGNENPREELIPKNIKERLGSESGSSEKDFDDKSISIKKPWTARFKVKTLWTTLFFSLITPINICFILGIIWSATGWTMLKFLNEFVLDLEKAVVAAGLFSSGVFMWEHPFFGGNIVEITIFSILHIVGLPLLGLLCFWIFKVDFTTIQVVMMCYAAPSGLASYSQALRNGFVLSSATYTFFWTYIVSLPVYVLWTVVFNETKLVQAE